MQTLRDKVAVITGGSSGIGRAAALAFAAEGAHVAIGARRVEEGQATVRLVEDQGGTACFVQTDVTQSAQVKRLVDTAIEHWGRLDYAFNNAGVEGVPFVKVADYSEQVWDKLIDINLKGVFLSMKHEIPHMLKQGGGAIVNMASVAGLIGGRLGAAYYASKHGVIGITKAVALEYAKENIRVNAVCPAIIQTPMAGRLFEELDQASLIALHPLGRFGTPEEVAQAVVWLCSDKASFVTGYSLAVDGGFLAR